jgi:hypothetical protein
MLATCQGGPKKTATKYGHDYNTIRNRCVEYGIDYHQIRKRYDSHGEFLSRGRVKQAVNTPYRNTNDIQKVLHKDYYTIATLCEYYDLTPVNHVVVTITPGPSVPVYDLTIEDTECFIAGGVAVHNSRDPNILNLVHDTEFRRGIRAEKGWSLFEVDYKAGEPMCLAVLSGEPTWIKVFEDGVDLYRVIATKIPSLGFRDPDDVTDHIRNVVKVVTLAWMYGESARSLARRIDIPFDEAQTFQDSLRRQFPLIHDWQKTQIHRAVDGKPIINLFGNRVWFELQRGPNGTADLSSSYNEDVIRSLLNFPIQGLLGEIDCWMLYESMGWADQGGHNPHIRFNNAVYDSIWGEIRTEWLHDGVSHVIKICEDGSRLPFDWPVPLRVDAKAGPNLAEMRPIIRTPQEVLA